MYLYIYIYTHICMYTYVYIYIQRFVHIRIYMSFPPLQPYVCKYLHMYINLNIDVIAFFLYTQTTHPPACLVSIGPVPV